MKLVGFLSRNFQSIPKENSSKFPMSIFLLLFLTLQLIIIFNVFTVFRYFSIDVGDWWLVSPPHDLWCDPSKGEGIGLHCFGDYSLTAMIASESNPWNNSIVGSFNYPAGGLLLFKLLSSLELVVGIQNLGLFTYLFLTVISIAVPALLLSKQISLDQRILFSVGSITSLPALLIIDRGNSVGIAFAFVFLFIYFYKKGKIGQSILFLVISSLIKPQFAIFLLLLLFHRKWKQFFISTWAIGISQVASFLAWPNALPNSLEQAFRGILGYSSNWEFTNLEIPNYSIGRGFMGVATLFGINFSNQVQGIVVLILFFMSVTIFLLFKQISTLTHLVFLGTAASFAVNVTWGYYAIIPILYIYVLVQFDFDERTKTSLLSKSLVAIASALTLSRFIVVIPSSREWVIIDNTTTIGLMWLIISILMVILDWNKSRNKQEV
jgi:hypothetical protein